MDTEKDAPIYIENEAGWYEVEPGEWHTSSSQLARIEMSIKEIIWRLRIQKND